MVRGSGGAIPWQDGPDLHEIKEWRSAQTTNDPRSLEDYYVAHGFCFECRGHGAKMVGWSDPLTAVDIEAAREMNLQQLPLYDVCPRCNGTGKR